MSSTTLSGPAPADRAPGRRGPRGGVAAALVIAAALALVVIRFRSTYGGGGFDNSRGGYAFQFTYQTPAWSTTQVVLCAAALLGAGTIMWLARTRRTVALAALLAGAGTGGLAWTIATPNDTRVSPLVYRGAYLGMTESSLTGRLGSPISSDATAQPSHGRALLGCLVYRAVASAAGPQATLQPLQDPSPAAQEPSPAVQQPSPALRDPARALQASPVASGRYVSPDVTGVPASNYVFCFDHGRLTAKGAM